ncbi:N-acetylmuramoyl-L-alanine amidase [Nannocystis sp. ILAH1]|uniref:N-acetylmuramoyl-L-alanine amidase n=1 Tax=Nannocystis sp. ILAH1 TaxID=2996789 RepID=UPI002270674C|nr:N-acetylmuramoyl-L-alanine amidase [Nannocystis sp. ILAH1]MCY0985989.1 N-acetylmuramoyl-L-alanine amidase [Nannocystis sp. ILAH1]
MPFAPRIIGKPLLELSSPRDGAVVDTAVIHSTAGSGEPEAVARYLRKLKPGKRASYTLVIGRDGDAVLLMPLDRAAWHAGDDDLASWTATGDGGLRVNPCSIGIALCNRGPWPVGPLSCTVNAEHPKRGVRSRVWETYPQAQIDALIDTLIWCRTQVPTLTRITGHEDVTAGKIDPGPALPWEQLAAVGLQRWRGPWPLKSGFFEPQGGA